MTTSHTSAGRRASGSGLQVYDVTVETKSPVHIGTGVVIRPDEDFILAGRRMAVLDVDKVLDAVDERKLVDFEMSRAGTLASMLPDRRNAQEYARYVVPVPMGTNEPRNTQVREAIKDPSGVPYLPGSSLKGAIRTALAVALVKRKGSDWLRRELGRLRGNKPERASEPIMKELFGKAPLRENGALGKASDAHVDVLRALRVSDLLPSGVDPADTLLEVAEVKVMRRGGDVTGIPIFVEAVKVGTVFRGTITADVRLLSEPVMKETVGAWRDVTEADLTTGLVGHCATHSRELIEKAKWLRPLQVMAAQRDDTTALMAVGWGTGWTAKTLGHVLKTNSGFQNVGSRLLGRRGFVFDANTFPSTYRMTIVEGRPHQPMGWLRMTITPRGER